MIKKTTNTKPKIQVSTGGILNPEDHRDFPVSADINALPDVTEVKSWSYNQINLFPVLNQGSQPACVGHAESTVKAIMDFEETGKPVFLSPRYLYSLCKSLDGIPDVAGTFPRVAGKALLEKGCVDILSYPNNTDLSSAEYNKLQTTPELEAQAVAHKIKAYSFCVPDLEIFLSTIKAKNAVGITLVCNNPNTWYNLYQIPAPTGKIMGFHRVLAYGWERLPTGDVLIKCRNSWGDKAHGEGKGNFTFLWSEYKASIFDIMPYIDVVAKVKEEVKTKDNTFVYQWNRNLNISTNGGYYKDDIQALQKALKILGFFYDKVKGDLEPTGYYGSVTTESIKRFQKAKSISQTGSFAFLTRQALNQEFQKKSFK